MINYTAKVNTVLRIAEELSRELGHGHIGSEHLLFGLVKEGTSLAAIALKDCGVNEQNVLDLITKFAAPDIAFKKSKNPQLTPGAKFILEQAENEALQLGNNEIGTENILVSVLKTNDCVASRILNTIGVNYQKLYTDMISSLGGDIPANPAQPEATVPESATPTLDQYSRDLTKLARERKLDPVIGRSVEIMRVIQILSRRTKNNPCLIGEPGVGKTAVVEGLAQQIVAGTVPETIRGKRLLSLDISGMVAGTKYRGEFEERIKKVISEARESGDALIFIDEIHTIIGAGGAEGALDAANILKPALARGEIQVIGATTIDEYRKHIEKDTALERRFQPVDIDEPNKEETLEILKGLRSKYEEHHGVVISDAAIEAAVKLSERYINDRRLPDKAIDLIDEACSKLRLSGCIKHDTSENASEKKLSELHDAMEKAMSEGRYEDLAELRVKEKRAIRYIREKEEKKKQTSVPEELIVTDADVSAVVSNWTKIPVSRLTHQEADRIRNLEEILHQRIVSQDEAVSAIAKAIKRGRVGIKDPRRPIGSFMFLGPTGVGKTELSKALAEAVFGTENALIRVDMSEFMEKHSVSRLIGSPPGYVGFEEGGQLSEKIRRNPYSVVLFDEIEKAHPDVFNVLLQVLDDGHITDAQGRKVNFKNTIIIMTSNAGAQNIIAPKKLGFASADDHLRDYNDMKDKVMDEVRTMFKPEFLNRLDEIIVFHQLTKDNMGRIVDIMLSDINKRSSGEMGISFSVTPEARQYLIDEGYDPKFGARPLRRVLQTMVEDRLAEEILTGQIHEGDRLIIDLDPAEPKKLTYSLKKPANRRNTKRG